jgi:alpha-mannosidase
MPHTVSWRDADIYHEVERFNLPLQAAQAGRGGGDLPKDTGFIEVQPSAISVSAVKKCEHRDTLVLRLFNPTGQDISGTVAFRQRVVSAWLTNMNEERREELRSNGNLVTIEFRHKQIITCEGVLA